MREIKFRVWDLINKRWLNLWTIKLNIDGSVLAVTDMVDLEMYGMHQVELMQYTGLHDKNGKEIYEGDIVKEGSGPGGPSIGTIDNINGDTVVKFLPGTIPDDWNHEYYPVFGKMDHSEVIGNIYENPGLL